MKASVILLIFATIVSCAKKSSETKSTVQKTQDSVEKVFLKSGSKCSFVDESGIQKDVFLSSKTTSEGTVVSFHAFKENKKITILGATLGGFQLISFSMINGRGTTVILHPEMTTLNTEGKTIMIKGRLTLDNEMNGVLEQSSTIETEQKEIKVLEFKEVGRLEHCQAFNARWG